MYMQSNQPYQQSNRGQNALMGGLMGGISSAAMEAGNYYLMHGNIKSVDNPDSKFGQLVSGQRDAASRASDAMTSKKATKMEKLVHYSTSTSKKAIGIRTVIGATTGILGGALKKE